MKFQSLIIKFAIFCIIIIGNCQSKQDELSEEENKERLRTCGKDELPKASLDTIPKEIRDISQSWLWWGFANHGNNNYSNAGVSTATMISPRHLLSSSQLVMKEGMVWRIGGRHFNNQCNDGNHFTARNIYLRNLEFTPFTCQNNPQNCVSAPIVKAIKVTLLNICNTTYTENFNQTYSPMLVEIDFNYPGSTPCLPDKTTHKKRNRAQYAQSYGLFVNEEGVKMKHSEVDVMDRDNTVMMVVTSYNETSDRGGPLLFEEGEKWTMIGVSASGTGNPTADYFDIRFFQDDLCKLAGICSAPLVPPAVPPPDGGGSVLKPPPYPKPSSSSSTTTTTLVPPELETTSSTTLTMMNPTVPPVPTASEPETSSNILNSSTNTTTLAPIVFPPPELETSSSATLTIDPLQMSSEIPETSSRLQMRTSSESSNSSYSITTTPLVPPCFDISKDPDVDIYDVFMEIRKDEEDDIIKGFEKMNLCWELILIVLMMMYLIKM